MAFVANPMVISSCFLRLSPAYQTALIAVIPLRFPLVVEVSGLGAHRCACGFEYQQSRFLRTYRTTTSESIPLHWTVAWAASVILKLQRAKQHPAPHLHLKPQRGNVPRQAFPRRMGSTGT